MTAAVYATAARITLAKSKNHCFGGMISKIQMYSTKTYYLPAKDAAELGSLIRVELQTGDVAVETNM